MDWLSNFLSLFDWQFVAFWRKSEKDQGPEKEEMAFTQLFLILIYTNYADKKIKKDKYFTNNF